MDGRPLSIGSHPAALPEYGASFLLGSRAQVLCFTHSVKRTIFCFMYPLAIGTHLLSCQNISMWSCAYSYVHVVYYGL